ncbi:EAL domain-containing protein [Vibrio sp. SCSIO 43137]|uniref:EAL domain-containing protein n=1 Tax=Vibrio sp. SCSIO 43137 TaxID=3021011 RepID=UPI002307A266|nr:EAL domain-containing protein [Vibrio sp. SCSIO 43137]WCE31554.1 EAL domain-containing protein [Vibrio sp. SCSIO 43137]
MHANLDKLQTAVWIYDFDNFRIIWANSAAVSFWGCPDLDSLLQRDLSGSSHAVKQALLTYKEGFKHNKVYQENWQFTPNDQEVEAFCQYSGVMLDDGRTGMLVEAIRIDEVFSKYSINNSLIISSYTESGDFISGNPPFVKEYGDNVSNLQDLIINAECCNKVFSTVNQDKEFDDDVLLNSASGEQWYRLNATPAVDANGTRTILLHHHNINERKNIELSLQKQASTDPLTKLLNRRGLNQVLQQAIESPAEGNIQPFTLLYIDLDGFKLINDAYGHSTGDKLLIEVAERLSRYTNNRRLLTRFGGDEFILYIADSCCGDDIKQLSRDIIRDLSSPFTGVSINTISASIGSVCYPKDAGSVDQLISRADAAMYQAKQTGKKKCVIYQQGMELGLKRASDISGKLADAIRQNQLCVYYQPIIDKSRGELVSFEALLRWQDNDLGFVNPEEIIRIAENTGMIQLLEQWVLQQALTDLCVLRQMFEQKLTIAVNMSGMHLNKSGVADQVVALISRLGLEPSDLTIELTENVLVDNLENDTCQAQELARRGVKVSIDDFGTGYSSLAYLHLIPATTLKVDRMFTENAQQHKVTLECIRTLSNAFNIRCLIEGIETIEQSDLLHELGFQLQQGYLFGKPQPLDYYQLEANVLKLKTASMI